MTASIVCEQIQPVLLAFNRAQTTDECEYSAQLKLQILSKGTGLEVQREVEVRQLQTSKGKMRRRRGEAGGGGMRVYIAPSSVYFSHVYYIVFSTMYLLESCTVLI